jgi:glycosyltransferase involved in cell wall biosynthesis
MNYLAAVDCFHLDRSGGAYRIAWEIARKMRNEGHRVALLCIGDKNKTGKEIYEGIEIVRYLPGTNINPLRKVENHIARACAAARNYLDNCKWDIVHAHTPLPGLGAFRAFGQGARSVYTIHSPVVTEQQINWSSQGLNGRLKLLLGMGQLKKLEATAYQKFDILQSLSQFTKNEINRLYGVGDKIRVIPYWSPFEKIQRVDKQQARQKLGWPVNKPIFFSLRRMTARMGLADAVEASRKIARQCDFQLVLAGDGPLREKLQKQVKKAGLNERVLFTGRLTDEQVGFAYQAADLFLLPTISLECFGIIILEAYSFGCPVLASDCAAIPELVRPICPDLIFPAGNVEALANKLACFLDNKLLVPDALKLIAYVHNNYSQEVLFPKWRDMLIGDLQKKQVKANHKRVPCE